MVGAPIYGIRVLGCMAKSLKMSRAIALALLYFATVVSYLPVPELAHWSAARLLAPLQYSGVWFSNARAQWMRTSREQRKTNPPASASMPLKMVVGNPDISKAFESRQGKGNNGKTHHEPDT